MPISLASEEKGKEMPEETLATFTESIILNEEFSLLTVYLK